MMSAASFRLRHRAVLALASFALAGAHAGAHASAPSPEARLLKSAVAHNRALAPAPPLKEADFSRRSRLRQVTLSPDGAWIAFLETDPQGSSLQLMNTRTREKKQLLAAAGRAGLSWSADSGALFLDAGDTLSLVTVKDGAAGKLAAFEPKTGQRFVMADPSRPRHALVEEFDSAAGAYRLARIGADGGREVIYEGKRKLLDFLLDSAGRVSFVRALDGGYDQVVSRRAENGAWIEAARCAQPRACTLVASSDDGRLLTMTQSHNGDRNSLVELDLQKNTRRLLHSDPAATADLAQVLLSPRTRQPLLAVYDAPQRRSHGLTAAAKTAAADIARRFPDGAISIGAGAGDHAPRWLLTERGSRLSQERFWLYDRKLRAFEEILQQERRQGDPLPQAQLARKIAIDYRASDGALVHAYLTLPPGKDAATLPMVTMVHGGPWAAFDNDYSTLVQLLANRGYAVFQPNFRSSAGYGDKYMLAPKADFGNGRAQADIIEGVRWLVANGVGDRRRLGIMGDSFGGYATLLALTHAPGLFQFGFAAMPPPDFGRTMRLAVDAGALEKSVPFAVRLPALGIPVNDAGAMRRLSEQSPAANAAKLTRPLLIVAGANDPMVEIAAVTDYVAKLQGMGKPVSLLVAPDEGHNPRKPITRQAYLYLVQRMLHQYLGGPAVPAPGAELGAYLEQNMKANGALKL